MAQLRHSPRVLRDLPRPALACAFVVAVILAALSLFYLMVSGVSTRDIVRTIMDFPPKQSLSELLRR